MLYKALEKSITIHIKNITDYYDTQLATKDEQIQSLTSKFEDLQSENSQLKNKLIDMEYQLDETAQYQRRESIVFSGPAIPAEAEDENSSEIIAETVRKLLNVNFSAEDISVAHRLGKKRNGVSRPIIAKLISRTKKYKIVQARIAYSQLPNTNRPSLYVNESLTPTRRTLFYKVRQLRKSHSSLFKQLYTQDGKIVIKLNATENRKYFITNEKELQDFLATSPILQDSYATLNVANHTHRPT